MHKSLQNNTDNHQIGFIQKSKNHPCLSHQSQVKNEIKLFEFLQIFNNVYSIKSSIWLYCDIGH